MGTNEKENWYQKYVHEKALKSVLSYITSKGKNVKDVVILGDFFDNWMYERNAKIPSPSEIVSNCIDANKDVFEPGNEGNFIDMMEAIGGDFYYINGNHDMEIGVDAINQAFHKYNPSKKVKGEQDPKKNIAYHSTDGVVYGEHGHTHSLLCKVDVNEKNKIAPLPLGYFISRFVANIAKNQVVQEDLKSVAEIPDSGNPTFGIVKKHLDAILKKLNDPNLGEFAHTLLSLLGVIDDQDSLKNTNFNMADGIVLNGEEASTYYEWLKIMQVFNPFSEEGRQFYEADLNNSLDNVGRNLCDIDRHNVVIMGHTHVPKIMKRLEGGRIYANTGYMCPDLPGLENGSRYISFVEVENEEKNYTVRLMKVDYKTGEITEQASNSQHFH